MSITIEMLGSAPGSYMPKTGWLLYAGNEVAPLCRKPGGSYMAEDDMGCLAGAASGQGCGGGAIGGATSALIAPSLVELAGGSANLTNEQRAIIVGASTLLGGLAAGAAGQNALGGAMAAGNESLNNATSTKNPDYAAKVLGYDRETFGSMIHAMKFDLGLRGDDNVIWHINGDVEFRGQVIGNMHDY